MLKAAPEGVAAVAVEAKALVRSGAAAGGVTAPGAVDMVAAVMKVSCQAK